MTWSQSLAYGFDSFPFNVLFAGSAYVCLALCMGEMSSALPFSGGIFGFVRAAAGPYFAYVTTWFEIAFILCYVVVKVHSLIQIMIVMNLMTADFAPYAFVIFYMSSFVVNVLGGKPLWGLVSIIGFGAFCLYVIYLGGAAASSVRDPHSLDYDTYCRTNIPLNIDNIMPSRNNINGFYQGLQYIPLLNDSLKNPREQVPRALVICSIVFVLSSVFLSLSACSQYPGIKKLTKTKFPLSYGFSDVFNVSLADSNWFNLPGMYGVAFCLYYCAGKQIYAISKSGLLFNVFSSTTPVLRTPYLSYFIATAFGIGMNIYCFDYPIGYEEIRNTEVVASHFLLFIAFITYIIFKINYSSLARSFTSPLGIYGAVYGMGNYFIGLVGVIFFSGNSYDSVYALLSLFGFATILFWLFIAKNQSFSDEEKKMMFKAYLINANREKRLRILKRNKLEASNSNTKNKGVSTSSKYSDLLPNFLFTSNLLVRLDLNRGEPVHSARLIEPSTLVDDYKVSEPIHDTVSKDQGLVREASTTYNAQHSYSRMSDRMKYLSMKSNIIHPSDLATSTRSTHLDQQMAILAAGGILDRESEKALGEQLGFDIE